MGTRDTTLDIKPPRPLPRFLQEAQARRAVENAANEPVPAPVASKPARKPRIARISDGPAAQEPAAETARSKPARKVRRPDGAATAQDKRLAKNLAELVKLRGISGRELSKRADLSLDTVRNIVSGRSTSPRARTLQALADQLGVPLSALYGGEPPPAYVSVQLTRTVTIPELAQAPPGTTSVEGAVTREWTIPEEAVGGIAPEHLRIIVAQPGLRPYGIQAGDRLLVDLSHKQPTPPGEFIIADDRGGSFLAHIRTVLNRRGKLMVTRGAYTDQTEVDSVEILGRVVARWTIQ